MEWLINRRRMMYNKAVPPAYLTFEDNRIWTACCNAWGDRNKIVITDNGNNTVNIVTTFESKLNTTIKKSSVISTQTNVDNTGGTYTVGTTYEPIGITMEQCAAVTSFQTYLRNLGTDLKFTECRYFSITNVDNGSPFQNDKFLKIKFPNTLAIISFYNNTYKNTPIIDIPKSVTRLTYFYCTNISGCDVLILRCPTIYSPNYIQVLKSDIEVYVPQELLSDYKEHAEWSKIANNIYAIEGSDYEVFNDWEYDN